MNSQILCVEDDPQIQAANKLLLETKGFTVKLAMTIAEAKKAVEQEMPALIVLDIRLPDGSGLDLLRELRKTSAVPVIALTNNNTEKDIVIGLESGCDDYVPKPYTFSILYARIEALFRRSARIPEVVGKDRLSLDLTAGIATVEGTDLLLTHKEFALLLVFVQNEERFVDSEYLYEKVWKASMAGNSGAVRKTVSTLRGKISGSGWTISWSNGEGYIFMRE